MYQEHSKRAEAEELHSDLYSKEWKSKFITVHAALICKLGQPKRSKILYYCSKIYSICFVVYMS